MHCQCGEDLLMVSGENDTIKALRCSKAFADIENGMSLDAVSQHYYSEEINDIKRFLQYLIEKYSEEMVKHEESLKTCEPETPKYKETYTRFRVARGAVKLNTSRLSEL